MQMDEGKVPWAILKELTSLSGAKRQGIVLGAAPGVDVAAIDISKAIQTSQEFYSSTAFPILCFKTDPVTFPTSEPGRYAVTINANDLATAGALPFGFNATILLPPGASESVILAIQQQIHNKCSEMGVVILGGHSEVTAGVNHPVVSGAMIGFVPWDFFPPRTARPGDLIVCSGWVGAEGTGILLDAGKRHFAEQMTDAEIAKSSEIGKSISIVDEVLKVNRKARPNVIHDPTEGGVIGGVFEMVTSIGLGATLHQESFPIHDGTRRICSILSIDPLRLISSGCVLYIIDEERLDSVLNNSKQPVSVVGTIEGTDSGEVLMDGQSIPPPEADHVIRGLTRLHEMKNPK
jgi:hydrogenase expression/formation protein HypE